MAETVTTLTATGSCTTASTVVLVAAPNKEWHWRPQLTGTGTGGSGTTVVDSGNPFSNSSAHVGWRVRTSHAGTEQNGEVTSESTSTLTCANATFVPSPGSGDTYALDPPVGFRAKVVAYIISAGKDWGSDGTIKLESVNTVGTTTLETINVAAGQSVSVPLDGIERYGAIHGNLRFTTSQNGTASVEVQYIWTKTGAQLQYC